MLSINKSVLFILLLLLLLHLFTTYQASPFHHAQRPSSPEEPLFEEKTRLGSMPPSCYNKCNGCHPCMAVQVPTLPSHDRGDRVPSGLARPTTIPGRVSDLSAPQINQYSNYKPMGWKCRCDGRFYNP